MISEDVAALMAATLGLREGYIRRALNEGAALSSLNIEELFGADAGNHWWLRVGMRRVAHVWVTGEVSTFRIHLQHEWLGERSLQKGGS